MTPPTVTVYIQPLTQPRTEWCDECLLPSVIAFELVASTERATIGVATIRRCMDCGRET